MEKYKTGGSGKQFIRGEEFEGKGLKLKVEGIETITANEGYGATEIDYLVKEGILKPGEMFRYIFTEETEDGDVTRFFDSKSAVFFIAMKDCDPKRGDIVVIKRVGEKKNTRYFIKKVMEGYNNDDDIDLEEIPI
ncbi:MAG: hypothetical protein QXO70_05135 [Candidatus Pacearchaeota archaeon]